MIRERTTAVTAVDVLVRHPFHCIKAQYAAAAAATVLVQMYVIYIYVYVYIIHVGTSIYMYIITCTIYTSAYIRKPIIVPRKIDNKRHFVAL